jgi:uncharacterized protein (TIGR02145 family)
MVKHFLVKFYLVLLRYFGVGLFFFLFLSVFYVSPILAQTQTLVLQPGPADGLDAEMRSDDPNTNYGTAEDFIANAWTAQGNFLIERSLIQFDLTSIPTNSIVLNAILSLSTNLNSSNYQLDAGANTSYLLRVLASWNESLVTWNTQPPFSMLNPVILPQSTSDTEHYYVDVTSHVQDMVSNPSTNFGWLFKLQTEALYRCLVFASSDNTIISWRPKLTVIYCVIPDAAGTISGPDSVCQGDIGKVYTIPPITNATYYVWNLPAGASITSGANTNSITVSYSMNAVSGNLIVYGSDSCSTGTLSQPLPVTVGAIDSAKVSISASMNNVCTGTPVTFTATQTNGGTSPSYQWKVNGINAGTNSPDYTYNPVSGDLVSCVLTSSITFCISNNPAISNIIQMVVNPVNLVSVTISPSANPVCSGTNVTYTATPLNGGIMPSYQWKVNGNNAGSDSPVYTYSPTNGDIILCSMTSNLLCTIENPATSNTITMTVNPNLPVSITINASANPVCVGTQVIFTANPINPGIIPSYQWKVNGINAGTDNPIYSYIPVIGDIVACILTSDVNCPTGNPANSNTIAMSVNPYLPVSISITASNNPACAGIPVIFTATPINGGISPIFQWKVNGITAGTNNPIFTYNPQNGDVVECILTSLLTCTTNNPAISNTILMNINALPIVTFTLCNDSITTINAQPFRLKGGIPLSGTYSGAGVINGIFYPAIAGIGTHQINYLYTNVALCSATVHFSLLVFNLPAFTCGESLTDIRDNNIYSTVQIGSQCWMASNLNYGMNIASTQDQRDNCQPEYYCYNDNLANCNTKGGLYQWDEIMQYEDTPGLKGLCPPGWHVPTETEWTTLFAVYTNNGFAGSPLKYSGFSGFNALLTGVNYFNRQWDFHDFATFFWSSTPYGAYKAWAHGMNDVDPSVSVYPSLKVNAFSVRCLRD